MKEEFKQTLQAFYINQSETPYWSPPTQLPTQPGEENNLQFNNLLAVQQTQNTTLQQLAMQMMTLQTQLNNLTMINQNQMFSLTGNEVNGNSQTTIDPKIDQPYKRYC